MDRIPHRFPTTRSLRTCFEVSKASQPQYFWGERWRFSRAPVWRPALLIPAIIIISFSACRKPEPVVLSNSDYDIAVRLTDEALWDSAKFHLDLAETAFLSDSNWAGVVECWNLRAHALTRRGHFEAADSLLHLADSIGRRRVGVESAAHASTLNKRGLLYHRMGRLDEAMELFQSALSIRQKVLPRGHVDIGWSYNNLGMVNIAGGNYRVALRLFDSCHSILAASLPQNSPDIALVMNNIGIAYLGLGDYVKAERSHLAALQIRQAIFPASHPDIAQSYINLGNVYSRNRDFPQAIKYQEMSLQIRLVSNPNDPFLGTNYFNIARSYLRADSFNRALEYFDRSEKWFLQRAGVYKTNIARLQDEVGILYTRLGRYAQADSVLREAIKTWAKLNDPSYHPGFPHINLAEVLLRQGKIRDAHKHALTGLHVFIERLGDKAPETAMAWLKLADIYAGSDKLDSALAACQLAIQAVCPNFNSNSWSDNPDLQVISDPVVLLEAFRKKANFLNAHKEKSNRKFAYDTYQTAVELLDLIRGYLQSDVSKFSLADTAHSVFERGIEIAYSQMRTEDIFQFMERSRAQVMWESFQKSSWLNTAPSEILDMARSLNEEVNFRRQGLLKELQRKRPSPNAVKKLKSELFKAEEEYGKFIRDVERNHPRFAAIRFRKYYPSIDTVRNLFIRDQTAVVQYFWGQHNVWVLAITSDSLFAHPIGTPSEIWSLVEGFLTSLKTRTDSIFVTGAHLAYRKLLPSAMMTKTDLIIVPDGPLFNVPFESLLTEPVDPARHYRSWPFLIRKASIRYGPSLSLLILDQNHQKSGDPTAFAPGKFR